MADTRTKPEQTGWMGWILFAATMMLMLGVFHAVQGLVAIFRDEYYVVGRSGLTLHVDYTVWGWVHLVLGLVVAGAGAGLLTAQMWARVVGVLAAGVSAVVNMAFLAAYPFWSVVVILVDVLVIWAITVHGREIAANRT
ncbi:DUF7144 family membrane protein [Nocardioides sp. MAHUQ-72]|uniref:DUF7144 family membrane protein n=1 Tax=unclassified Nocardioides TaxID=2615069 RepID=UPI0036074272